MIKDEVLHISNSYGNRQEIAPGDNDQENNENTVFIGMKEYGETFIVGPVHKMKKVFYVKIPSRASHIIKNMIHIYQDACEETNEGIQERSKNEVEDNTTSQ